jgi:hypothetical protein
MPQVCAALAQGGRVMKTALDNMEKRSTIAYQYQ